MAYKNTTSGARAIHFHTGNHLLVEPGDTVEVQDSRVKRVAPGLVRVKGSVPDIPKDLVKKARATAGKGAAKKPADPALTTARAEYKAKFGKLPSPRASVASIREKIAAA